MKEDCKPARLLLPLVVVTLLVVWSQPAFAARFRGRIVRFTVSIDGKVVLEARRIDTRQQNADTVWRYVDRLELRPVRMYKVEADGDDPLRATLKGKVVIQTVYGGRAQVSRLELVRDKKDAPWKLAPAEVERTFVSRETPFRLWVKVGGKVVLMNRIKWTLERDVATVWRNLDRVELRPFLPRIKVQANTADPLHATLKGKVSIVAEVGGKGEQAEVSELKLDRDNVNAPWRIDPADVERTFQSRTRPK
jgi:hypothetical protein